MTNTTDLKELLNFRENCPFCENYLPWEGIVNGQVCVSLYFEGDKIYFEYDETVFFKEMNKYLSIYIENNNIHYLLKKECNSPLNYMLAGNRVFLRKKCNCENKYIIYLSRIDLNDEKKLKINPKIEAEYFLYKRNYCKLNYEDRYFYMNGVKYPWINSDKLLNKLNTIINFQ